MARPEDLLRPTPEGLYCPAGGFHIDPVRPVARAVITHGHADHARPGHGVVVATPETLRIMQVRYGADCAGRLEPAAYGERMRRDGVEVTLVPAGHVLGSAQAVLRGLGQTIVVSGDYKRRADSTCAPFEPIPCDVFVTEATFGLPVFRHPDDGAEIGRLLTSLAQFPDRTHLVGAYALGKAQRIIRLVRAAGWDRTIYVHGALERLNGLYESSGIALGSLAPVASAAGRPLAGEIVLAPPGATRDRWSRRFAEPVVALASGWMGVRARARQRGAELPLVISDHADWDELTRTLEEVDAGEVWITHGREEGLLRWCELTGRRGRALRLIGYEDEEGEPAAD